MAQSFKTISDHFVFFQNRAVLLYLNWKKQTLTDENAVN